MVMARMFVGFVLVASAAFTAVPALAADAPCNAVALLDVPDWGDGYAADAAGTILKKGEIDEEVSQYHVPKKGGMPVICAHGGYCYPRYVMRDGQRVETLRIVNCHIGKPYPSDSVDDFTIYRIVPDDHRHSASAGRVAAPFWQREWTITRIDGKPVDRQTLAPLRGAKVTLRADGMDIPALHSCQTGGDLSDIRLRPVAEMGRHFGHFWAWSRLPQPRAIYGWARCDGSNIGAFAVAGPQRAYLFYEDGAIIVLR